MNRWTPATWRYTVEFDSWEQAKQYGPLLMSLHPRRYSMQALSETGEVLWSEDGDPAVILGDPPARPL